MQIRLTRTAKESRTGHMKIVRVPSTVHAVPRLHDIVLPSRPQPKADQPQSARAVPVDDTPAVRARRARWKIRRLFKDARRAAKGQVRLRRADEYELLRCAYAAVRCWQEGGVAEEIERELRTEAQVAVSRSSSLFAPPPVRPTSARLKAREQVGSRSRVRRSSWRQLQTAGSVAVKQWWD